MDSDGRVGCTTYAAGRPVLAGRMASVEDTVHIDPFDHCLAGKPYHFAGQGRGSGLHHLGQTGSQWVGAEDEIRVDRLALVLVEVDLADRRPGWQQLEHDRALLPACAESLPPSCAPSTPCESL